MLQLVRRHWPKYPEFQSAPDEVALLHVLRGMMDNYHDDPKVTAPIIFDKSRGWMRQLDFAEAVLGRKIKALVCVRDIRDCIASFERLWRKNIATRQLSQEFGNYFKFQTVEGRCEAWMNPRNVVGSAYKSIEEILKKGFRDRMLFVHFEKLSASPKETMQRAYEFLGEPYYEHDFDHVEQVTHEDDEQHGIPELHIIRPKVEPIEPQWPKVLGKAADLYAPMNDLWLKLDESIPLAPLTVTLPPLPPPGERERRPSRPGEAPPSGQRPRPGSRPGFGQQRPPQPGGRPQQRPMQRGQGMQQRPMQGGQRGPGMPQRPPQQRRRPPPRANQ